MIDILAGIVAIIVFSGMALVLCAAPIVLIGIVITTMLGMFSAGANK